MGIGGSILLIVIGAILAFGVRDTEFGPFQLNVVGWIFMIAGLGALVLTLWVWNSRRTRVVAGPPPAGGAMMGPRSAPPSTMAPPPNTVAEDQVVEERYTERRNY
jgi:Domain of unknown function (DUF6458)